jgi:serine/threonine-protein kinase RsbW
MEKIRPDQRLVRLTIPGRLVNVPLVGRAVRAICAELPVDSETAYQIELCVIEAVNNAVMHGTAPNTDQEVEICIELRADRATFSVSDHGRGTVPCRPLDTCFDPADLEQLPQSGLGLRIIHSVMDQVRESRTPSGYTLIMVKKWGAETNP